MQTYFSKLPLQNHLLSFRVDKIVSFVTKSSVLVTNYIRRDWLHMYLDRRHNAISAKKDKIKLLLFPVKPAALTSSKNLFLIHDSYTIAVGTFNDKNGSSNLTTINAFRTHN